MAIFSTLKLDKKIEVFPGPVCLNVIANNLIMIMIITIYLF